MLEPAEIKATQMMERAGWRESEIALILTTAAIANKNAIEAALMANSMLVDVHSFEVQYHDAETRSTACSKVR